MTHKGDRRSPFHRMPPLCLNQCSGQFHIDYAALFLFDRVIVDEVSYNEVLDPNFSEIHYLSEEVMGAIKKGALEYATVLKSLEKEGRLTTKNFDELHAMTRPLIDKALESDLKTIPYWTKPIKESIGQWTKVINGIREARMPMMKEQRSYILEAEEMTISDILHNISGTIYRGGNLVDGMKKWKKKLSPTLRKKCRELLSDYLAYINFNLLLGVECGAAFTDWQDMQPLYAAKFKAAKEAKASSQDDYGGKVLAQGRQLFNFMFPYFLPKSPKELLKALNDKRVVKLREFVTQSLERGVELDSAMCTTVLRDVLRIQSRSILRRKITGWSTLPLGVIPVIGTGIQKGVAEIIDSLWADRSLEKYSWFYLLNELDVSMDDDSL